MEGMATANMSNISSIAEKVWYNPVTFGVRCLFYATTPAESSYATVPEVPDYFTKAIPYFLVFQFMEMSWNLLKGRTERLPQLNDALSSMSAGLFFLLPLLLSHNLELDTYILFYGRYNITPLPWDSAWTWWLTMLLYDFAFYWVHRATHEMNLLWSAHQVHHSSENYNMSTALRQPLFQKYFTFMIYLPMAFFIPPSIFFVHLQLNLLYQYWIHTTMIDSLGPLEYILNTASHHRVHHGRNRYCIDCNYGGVLIIWDRIFGTFHPENEEVVYGLVHPLSSWDPIYTQFCHLKYIFQTVKERKGFWNKLYTFIKGPGWEPGKPRLGNIEDIPDIHAPQPKYDTNIPLWATLYAGIHLAVAGLAYSLTQENLAHLTFYQCLAMALYVLWIIIGIGYVMEDKWYAPAAELLRCVVHLAVDSYLCTGGATICNHWVYWLVRIIFLTSATIWLLLSVKMIGARDAKKVD